MIRLPIVIADAKEFIPLGKPGVVEGQIVDFGLRRTLPHSNFLQESRPDDADAVWGQFFECYLSYRENLSGLHQRKHGLKTLQTNQSHEIGN